MQNKKPKILFYSATSYEDPIDESISKKFELLGEIAVLKICAYSSKKDNSHSGLSIFHLYRRPKNRFIRYIKTIYITFFPMRQQFSRADIVIVQDPVLALFVFLSIEFLSEKPKVVVESHGDFIETIALEKTLTFPKGYKFLFGKIASYTLNKADCLRVISSSTREQVNFFTKEKPIVEFPAWIDLNNFLNANYDPHQNTVLFLGSMSERKNPLLILRSLNYLKKKKAFKLALIGPPINAQYLDKLNSYIVNNNLNEHVTIKEEIDQKEVIEYLSKASLLVLPSVSEGLGRVILEAQAVGCPVLVSDAGGMKDLIEDTKTGFIFKNNNFVDLSEKIEYILGNPDLMKEVSTLGRKSLVKFHESDSFLNGYKEIIQKVLR